MPTQSKSETTPPAPTPPKKGGKWLKGCLIALLVLVILLVLAVAGIYYFIRKTVMEYTDSKPLDMTPVVLTDSEREEFEYKMKLFKKAVDENAPGDPVVLTPFEINDIIQSVPAMKGRAFVELQEPRIRGKLSLPLTPFEEAPVIGPMIRGRYLNGSAVFKVTIEGQKLVVNLTEMEANGHRLPQNIMDNLSTHNLAENVNSDPKVSKYISKLKSLAVTKDRLVVTLLQDSGNPPNFGKVKPEPQPEPESTSGEGSGVSTEEGGDAGSTNASPDGGTALSSVTAANQVPVDIPVNAFVVTGITGDMKSGDVTVILNKKFMADKGQAFEFIYNGKEYTLKLVDVTPSQVILHDGRREIVIPYVLDSKDPVQAAPGP